MNLSLQPTAGPTYVHARDAARIFRQVDAVTDLMLDGRWRSLREIARECRCSEASASARLRDLRKPRFGGYDVQRAYFLDGLWFYRVLEPRAA